MELLLGIVGIQNCIYQVMNRVQSLSSNSNVSSDQWIYLFDTLMW